MSGINRLIRYGFLCFLAVIPVIQGYTQQRLVFSTADTVPFSTVRDDGFYDLLLADALKRLGIELEITHLPSERSLTEANAGRVDGEFGRTEIIAELYPQLRIVPEPLVEWQFSAFVRTGTPEPEGFEDLAGFHLAYIRGWKIYDDNVTEAASITLVSDEDQLFGMLGADRVDVILYNHQRGLHYLTENETSGIRPVEPPLATRPMFLFLHRSHASLIEPLAETLREMKSDGSYARYHRQVFGEER